MERSEALGLPPELKSHRGPCFLVPHFARFARDNLAPFAWLFRALRRVVV